MNDFKRALKSSGKFIFGIIILMLFAWIFFEYKVKVKRVNPEQKKTCRCPICAYVYIYDSEEDFSRCPRCSSINKSEGKKRE